MEESPFHSASASPSGLRSSRTELYPLNLQRPRVGQIKPPKWAKQLAKSTYAYILLLLQQRRQRAPTAGGFNTFLVFVPKSGTHNGERPLSPFFD
jgi:hypothetical protein